MEHKNLLNLDLYHQVFESPSGQFEISKLRQFAQCTKHTSSVYIVYIPQSYCPIFDKTKRLQERHISSLHHLQILFNHFLLCKDISTQNEGAALDANISWEIWQEHQN